MNDKVKGLYNKFYVQRRDDPTGKHDDCEFFVIDLNHDSYAIPALEAYANACEKDYPLLAAHIRIKATELKD